MKKYITVLDQSVSKVCKYIVRDVDVISAIERNNTDVIEDLLVENGHSLSNINWMVHDESFSELKYTQIGNTNYEVADLRDLILKLKLEERPDRSRITKLINEFDKLTES